MYLVTSAGYHARRSVLTALWRPNTNLSMSRAVVRVVRPMSSTRDAIPGMEEENREKHSGKQALTDPMGAPGWDPHKATASEQAVKADRAEISKEDLDKFAVETARDQRFVDESKASAPVEDTEEESQAQYDKEELEGPLKSARGQ